MPVTMTQYMQAPKLRQGGQTALQQGGQMTPQHSQGCSSGGATAMWRGSLWLWSRRSYCGWPPHVTGTLIMIVPGPRTGEG